MAKFTPGPMVAAVSGSVGGTVFSRNRYGAYTRFRAIPVTSGSTYALAAKARLSNVSQSWATLTAAQKLAWSEWAAQNPIIDKLGAAQVLAGNVAFIRINTFLQQAGESELTAPPITSAPDPLLTLSLTGDIGAGSVSAVFTGAPLGATGRLIVQAAVVNSAGINYVTNYLRLVTIAAAATASPLDIQSVVEARFGTLVVGQYLHVLASVLDNATGLRSRPLRASVVITTT